MFAFEPQYPPKSIPYHSECDFRESLASLECPSPPAPPIGHASSTRDPQTRLIAYLKELYLDLAQQDPTLPAWVPATTPGALSAARLEPELRLCMHTHGTADHITVDQLLTAIHTKDGAAVFFEPPRRVLIESPTWGTRSALALRLLYAWARGPPWPKRGAPPVALAIYAPMSLNGAGGGGGLAAYVERHLINGKNAKSRFGRGLSGRGFQSAWGTLPALGQKLLFVLNDDADFYQSAFGPAAEKAQSKATSAAAAASTKLPADIRELLAGRLFPDARVIIIIGDGASSSQHGGGSGIVVGTVHHTKNHHRQSQQQLYTKNRQKRHNISSSRHQSGDILQQLLLPPLIHRHVTHRGLTWGRSASLLGGGEWGAPSCLLDTVQHTAPLRNIARTPLGCLALAAIYSMNANNASPSISQPSVNTIDDEPLRGRGGGPGGNEMLPTEEIDAVESVVNYVTAGFSDSAKAALGRLALFSLKAKRSSVTADEIRLYCVGIVELYYQPLHLHDAGTRLGCFEHIPAISGHLPTGVATAKTTTSIYTPICAGVMEFLAANYLATLAQRPGHLSAEIAGLATSDLDIEPPLLKVLTFAMALLGQRGHILLSLLTPLWLSPAHVFALSLAAGDSGPNSRALCALLGINKSPTVSAAPLLVESTLHIWVQCRSTPAELLGWAMALRSQACRLKSLELNYQIDKHTASGGAAAAAARVAVDTFLAALSCNESVATLRISSLIETDVTEADVQLLAQCVARALLKPRLMCFELILTLLEEDPPALKLQPVVQALCRSLPRQPALRTVHLDLGLCSSQIIELCTTMEQHQQYQLCYGDAGGAGIRNVSLPHLRCERASVAAIARLLAVRKLTSLALPHCWGTGAGDGVAVSGQTRADDAPSSSSGVSMGSSGAGSASSSTGTSCLIKQSSITSAVSGGQQLPSPGRLYNPVAGGAAFCSLPRGNHRSALTAAAAAAATASTMATAVHQRQPSAMYANVPAQQSYLGRSATLPRPPPDAEPQYKQRSYDSVVSRTWGANTSATNTMASSSMAAYETIASVGGVLHDVLMAARETDSCMASLDLSKAQLTVEDALCLGETVRQSCTLHSVRLEGAARLSEILPAMLGVGESQSVQMLVLASPRLSVDDGAVQRVTRALMCCPTLRLLVLDGWSFRFENPATLTAIQTGLSYTAVREVSLNNCRVYLSANAVDATLESTSIVALKLAGIQIITTENVLRGPQIISHLCGFTALRDLDISAPSRTGLAVATSPLIIDDKGLLLFFNILHCHFRKLTTLKLCNWILHLDDAARTFRMLAKCLRHSPLNHIKVDGVSVLDRPRKVRVEQLLLNTFLVALHRLRWLEISLAGKRDDQIVAIGESIMRMKCDEIDIKISDSNIEHARLLAQTVSTNSKFDIGVSTFGTSSGILVHVEKVRSSSSRKT